MDLLRSEMSRIEQRENNRTSNLFKHQAAFFAMTYIINILIAMGVETCILINSFNIGIPY